MGVLITTIVASILFYTEVINTSICVALVGGSIIWAAIGAILYFKCGLLRFFYHNFLGWHVPDPDKRQYNDGCSDHAVCKHCGKDIMQDSQGNWF